MGRHATTATLAEAARLALAAPSIFNTQPWRWVIHGAMLELRADHSRQLRAVDPTGRMLTISCGVALHHAVVALYPHTAEVGLYPDPADPGLLAIVRVSDGDSDRRMTALREAIGVRRTDRRAFGKKPVFGNILDRLAAVCHEQHAHLYQVPWQHMPAFALAAVAAGALQLSDPEYRIELADWTHRPVWSGDGVPVETAAGKQARRVPVRDFAPFGGEETLPTGLDNDFGAVYGIISTDADNPAAWLAAGMALSAVLLTATAAGLGTATISDITEAGPIREQLRQLVPAGHPQVAVRIGHAPPGHLPATPRRTPAETITVIS